MPAPPPTRPDLEPTWASAHGALHQRVREALTALPFYFRTETVIAGINATDIFNLNAALGAAIEEQIVATLNAMRPIWDPDERYTLYGFVRQSQTFPDVLLRRLDQPGDRAGILMGLELKGWYLLAKEGEPSFRYAVTPAACNPQDLLVVVPWALSNVIGGSPRAFVPYVESARYAAAYRNHHWQHLRTTSANAAVLSPVGAGPYPRKADPISDRAASDPGGNFGRHARTGLMDTYIASASMQPISGIEARYWRAFFKAFLDQSGSAAVERALGRLAADVAASAGPDAEAQARADNLVEAIRAALGPT